MFRSRALTQHLTITEEWQDRALNVFENLLEEVSCFPALLLEHIRQKIIESAMPR